MNEPTKKIDTVVLGAAGYVAGELFRLLSAHPSFELVAAVSESQAGQPLESVFPHLQSTFGDHAFCTRAELASTLAKAPFTRSKPSARRSETRPIRSAIVALSCDSRTSRASSTHPA